MIGLFVKKNKYVHKEKCMKEQNMYTNKNKSKNIVKMKRM